MTATAKEAKRLVIVNNSRETFTPTVSGAIATCILELATEAVADGHDCHIITRPADAPPYAWTALHLVPPAVQRSGVAHKASRARRRFNGWARPDQWEYASEIRGVLRALKPEAVILNNDPELAVYIRSKFPRIRTVHWFHNLEMSSDRFRRAFALDKGLKSVAVSQYLARAVEMIYQLRPLSVASALNGVRTERFDTMRQARVPVVGYLGRLAVEKAPDTLLAASLELSSRGVEHALQIAGNTNWGYEDDNPYGRQVARMMDRLQEAGIQVMRTGHLTRVEVPPALQRTDVHVVPSRWDEPCGLTTLEGLASGEPVVGSATGGTPELLQGVGVLFARDDSAGLADVLQPLLLDAGWSVPEKVEA